MRSFSSLARDLSFISSSGLHPCSLVDTLLGSFHFTNSFINKHCQAKVSVWENGRKWSLESETDCLQDSFLFGNLLIWLYLFFPHLCGTKRVVLSVRFKIGSIAKVPGEKDCLRVLLGDGFRRAKVVPLCCIFGSLTCLLVPNRSQVR